MQKRLFVLAVVIVAALVRLPTLLHDGLWRDETFVYVELIAPTFGEFLHRVTETEWHPPLFFLLDYVWTRLVGVSELTLDLLPWIFSVATVPMVYILGRDADSWDVGVLAAAIYALAPLAINYSTEYVYPFAGFVFALLAWLVLHARREPMTVRRFLAIAVATLSCVYAHYTALFFLPMLAVWALVGRREVGRKAAIVAALAAGAAPFVLWLPVFLHQSRIGLPFEGETSVAGRMQFFMAALLQYVPVRPEQFEPVAFILLLAATIVVARSGRVKPDALALGIFFIVALALTSARDMLAIRYVIPFYALACVFLASTILGLATQIWHEAPAELRRFGFGASLAFLAIVAAGDVTFARSNSETPKSGMRAFVDARPLSPRTLYIIAPDYMASTFVFYTRAEAVRYVGFVHGSHPEIYRLEALVPDWNRAGAVTDAIKAIARQAREYQCIDFLIDGFTRNQGQVPFGRSWDLLERLEARYRLASHSRYPGRYEPVDAYRFWVTPDASGGVGQKCR